MIAGAAQNRSYGRRPRGEKWQPTFSGNQNISVYLDEGLVTAVITYVVRMRRLHDAESKQSRWASTHIPHADRSSVEVNANRAGAHVEHS